MKNFKEYPAERALILKSDSAENVARAMIESGGQKQPFHIFDMNEIYYRVKHFMYMMPRVKIFYAMKANNNMMLLKLAASLGLGFDCASPGEIKKILQLGIHPRSIIYTYPSKHPDHMVFAREAGVKHATFDTSYELKKMKQHWPDVSLLIRIRVESDCIYKLAEKFGCNPDEEAIDLLEEAASLGLRVAGVAFHVGSACFSPESFAVGLRDAHKLFKHEASKGRRMTIVDIGGGFLSETTDTIDEASKIINRSIEELFPDPDVQIIAEPGRYICDSAFSLYSNINNVRRVAKNDEIVNYIFINDGVHGTLGRSESWHTVKKFETKWSSNNDRNEDNFERAVLFGPSCDYKDQVMSNLTVYLPKITPSDWLVFSFQGSYTIDFQSRFCCLDVPLIRSVVSSDIWEKVKNHAIWSFQDFVVDPDINSVLPSTLTSVPEKPSIYAMETPKLNA